MDPTELQTAVAGLQNGLQSLRAEVQALRTEIAPLLKWKSGLMALVGLVITVGAMSRAVEWIIQLLHNK